MYLLADPFQESLLAGRWHRTTLGSLFLLFSPGPNISHHISHGKWPRMFHGIGCYLFSFAIFFLLDCFNATSAFPFQQGSHLVNVLFNKHLCSAYCVPAGHGFIKHFSNTNPQVSSQQVTGLIWELEVWRSLADGMLKSGLSPGRLALLSCSDQL